MTEKKGWEAGERRHDNTIRTGENVLSIAGIGININKRYDHEGQK